ncbi:MAG: hypothetical protein E6H43_00585 [Betaproteobacteria bacterium]|nr:MAG: hypothetical protein E6H43_00585 [Betaproteobacteria bacterium]
MKGLSGAETLLRVLRAMGVERIFASPGSDWAPLWEALAKLHWPDVPEYLSTRHEETAVGMATGYAKASGKLPAVVLHTTVGALHATMGVRAALHERIPMVVLAGESIGFAEGTHSVMGRQWLRLLTDVGGPARLMEHCVKWSFGLNMSAILPHTVQRACQLAMAAPKGPVFVSVPTEFLMEAMSADAPPAVLAVPPSAQPAAIEDLARMLSEARNPVIVTEEVGRSTSAVQSLVAVAELLGAPVLDAWQPYYVNFPREHPLYGGVVAEEMGEALREADLVFLVEAVAPWHPPSALPAPRARVAVLGEEPLHSNLPFWGFRTDLIVAGELDASLAALVEQLKKVVPSSSRKASIERWRGRHEKRRNELRAQARAAGEKNTIDNRWVGHQLNELMPPDAIFVDETITHRLDVVRLLDRLQPGSFFETSYGGLGMGLGMALGIKHALPERTVIMAIGDGAFHYNPVPASFGASQEHRLPLLVLLFDNAGYLSQKGDVVREYPNGNAVRTKKFAGTSIEPKPDYVALARAFGGHGEKVEKPGELRPALLRGFQSVAKGQLALVHLVLEPVNP